MLPHLVWAQFLSLTLHIIVWAVQVHLYNSNLMSHDSSSVKIEVYDNGETHRLLKLVSSPTNVQVYY